MGVYRQRFGKFRVYNLELLFNLLQHRIFPVRLKIIFLRGFPLLHLNFLTSIHERGDESLEYNEIAQVPAPIRIAKENRILPDIMNSLKFPLPLTISLQSLVANLFFRYVLKHKKNCPRSRT